MLTRDGPAVVDAKAGYRLPIVICWPHFPVRILPYGSVLNN